MASISTHVLDIMRGVPARGLPLLLRKDGVVIAEGFTQESGRSPPNFFSRSRLELGVYALQFNVSAYASGEANFFPEIVIHFDINNGDEDYHVPLLLSRFGYSTYRGC